MKPFPMSIRMPADLRAYVDALSALTQTSLNASIISMLQERMDADPLTRLQVIERRGRYTVSSPYTERAYGSFADRRDAMTKARTAIEKVGGDPDSVIDQTDVAPAA